MRISFLAATVVFATITCIAAQDFDFAGFRRCAQLAEQQYCTEKLDVVRETLEIVAKCNILNYTLLIANSCARDSESGLYCGAVYAYSRDIGASVFTCLSTIVGGMCTSECRDSLTAIRENLGCCINAVVNNTASVYAFAESAFTYDLWSRCGVDPPSSTCSGALNFTLPGSRQPSCIEPQSLVCSQSALDDIIDFYNNQGPRGCAASLSQYQLDICSRRENGDYCTTTVEGDINAFADPIQTACGPALVTQTCSDACKDLLKRFVDARGCCVNVNFNSTYAVVSGLNLVSPVLANNQLFQLCEVEPPPLTCGTLPFKVPFFTLFIPLIMATVFGRKMM